MKLIDDLAQAEIDVYISSDGKLKYFGRQSPSAAVSSLLAELKEHKDEVIQYLQTNRMDAKEAIRQAYAGILNKSVLIKCNPEYAHIWGGSPLWLCPDDASKQRIRQRYPKDFSLLADEFFEVCRLIVDEGQPAAVPVVEAMRLFGGILQKKKVSA